MNNDDRVGLLLLLGALALLFLGYGLAALIAAVAGAFFLAR